MVEGNTATSKQRATQVFLDTDRAKVFEAGLAQLTSTGIIYEKTRIENPNLTQDKVQIEVRGERLDPATELEMKIKSLPKKDLDSQWLAQEVSRLADSFGTQEIHNSHLAQVRQPLRES